VNSEKKSMETLTPGPNGHTGLKEPESAPAPDLAPVFLLQKQVFTFLS